MADTRLDQIDTAPSLTSMAYFVGTQDNEDGSFTDYKYTIAQLIQYVLAQTKKTITIGVSADTLSDDFFSNEISEIVTNGQVYQKDVDFSQSGEIITGITITFTLNQKVIAKI